MVSQPEAAGRSRKVRIALIALLAAVAIFFVGRAFGWWGAKPTANLTLYGNVEIREVQLGFRLPGRIEALLVDEGDRVMPGQVLAKLDTRPLQDLLASADARLAAASAGVARDINGTRPQELAEAQAAVVAARATLLEANRQLTRREALVGRGFISKADVQTAQAGVDSATARVASASAALSLAAEGVRTEDRAVTAASREAVLAEKRSVQTDLSDTTMKAPAPGQVLTRAREAGAVVGPGETVLTLALTQPVRVRAYVAEPDLTRVRPGMRVQVRVDGSTKQWPATIGFISPVAEFTPKTVQTEQLRADLVYRLRLTVADPKGELRQGQPVSVILPASRH